MSSAVDEDRKLRSTSAIEEKVGAARGMRFAGHASRGELCQVARRCRLHGVDVKTRNMKTRL
jgi:hypothetical protein